VTLAVGFSDLPIDVLGTMGGHRGLLRVVRAAIRAAVSGAANFEADAELDSLTPFFLEAARQPPASGVSEPGYELLPRLLRFSAKVRHRLASQVVDELEQRVDQLVAVIAQNRQEFDRQVRDAKLAALAEFAAGASHEINNPLAIISTNVQYLRSHEEEPERVETFDAILRQTKRIHEILYGARQFARPPRATPAVVAESAWVAGLAKEVSHDASARRVQLDLSGLHGPTRFWADVTHLRVIAGHLIRNAIEAVPPGGWVRAKCEQAGSNTLLIVEDSGPGPVSAAVPHLFDPFYSGRTAGRGRGLGLAIALRLAQQNNGDLYYDSRSGEPTRFVLRLPSSPPHEAELRRSA
jgi:signal transduction histidine kinase